MTVERLRLMLVLGGALGSFGCAGSEIGDRAVDPAPVSNWARTSNADDISLNWLEELAKPEFRGLIGQALAANFALAEQRIRLEDARQAVIIAGADRWPALNATVSADRRGSDSALSGSAVSGPTYGLNGDASWELDIWGELSASARAAGLDYEAQLASFEALRRDLVATTVSLGFEAISARQLLELFEQRLASLETTFDIVDGSYRRGLGSALDVYLAQNALEQQREVVAAQRQVVLESTATLQLALGRYPDGNMLLPSSLPLNTSEIPVGLPSELLTRRKDIRAAWLRLMAADARVAVAHKNRFPRLVLNGSAVSTSASLSDLLGSDETSWSIASTLTQPIFSGGRLRAAEKQARVRTQALEQQYLGLVYQAFADVENAISGLRSLNQRYNALQKAESNARAARELSLEQYQRGIVGFTTVLEAQRRAFDSGTSLARVQNQMIQNRVTLYRALGGEFVLDE